MSEKVKSLKAEICSLSQFIGSCSLPKWEEIPDLGLYMEQVLALLSQYLYYLPSGTKDEQPITAAAINNYVRNGVMPEPLKKRYYRVHIAYLIIIITLKQSLSLALIQKLIPVGLATDELSNLYASYIEMHGRAVSYFTNQAENGFSLATDADSLSRNELIAASSIVSGLAKLLSERLLLPEDGDEPKTPQKSAKKNSKKKKE